MKTSNEKVDSSINNEIFQNESEVYSCQFCEENIDWHQKENHYGICNKFESFITDHICQLCDKIFDSNINLTNHIQWVHRKSKILSDSNKYSLEIDPNISK